MEIKTHNPTPWLQGFGLNHAVEVYSAQRTLYLPGQTASNEHGEPMHAGDLVAQYKLAWANVVDALEAAGMAPTNLVRLNMYTVDVPAFMAVADQIMPIHGEAGAQLACTLLGVRELYHPDILIEIEGTAVA